MNRVVYNNCFGGFGLSKAAVALGSKLSHEPDWQPQSRHDPILLEVCDILGLEDCSARFARLAIADVSGMYIIDEYDGNESVTIPSDIDWVDSGEYDL